jgi:prolipoprotein diacylglyceryltransferase
MATVPWAVEDHGAFRHPTQLYSSFAAACTLAVLLALDRRGRLPENALFALQGALLCATRFVIEFYREPGATLGPLTVAQIACIGGFAFFATMLAAKLRTRTRFAARVPVAA